MERPAKATSHPSHLGTARLRLELQLTVFQVALDIQIILARLVRVLLGPSLTPSLPLVQDGSSEHQPPSFVRLRRHSRRAPHAMTEWEITKSLVVSARDTPLRTDSVQVKMALDV